MTVKFIKYYTGICLSLLLIGSVILYRSLPDYNYDKHTQRTTVDYWNSPDTSELKISKSDSLIRYGRSLISYTAAYLGPEGSVAHLSNGMNCQNCHLDAGTRLYGSNFALVASTYPRFRERSGRVESIEFRINSCMQRSLNGKILDSLSAEMRAMVAYIKWVGKNVSKNTNKAGLGLEELPYLDRAASISNGKEIYFTKCQSCHGGDGQGLQASNDSAGYRYPPLWGDGSFNVSAGLFRISRFASFVKHNMPYRSTSQNPQLSDEYAWDVAAFITTQKRPTVFFKNDWLNINSKPADFPFGPYADTFSEIQHKYGPFKKIKK